MADKYHNAWIILQKATAYRICMAEVRAYRFMTCDQKKVMLNSIYGYMAHNKCNSMVSKAPAADVVPVAHGRWATHYRSGTPVAEGYVSTCCDMWNKSKRNYCPHCGAKMDGGWHDAL